MHRRLRGRPACPGRTVRGYHEKTKERSAAVRRVQRLAAVHVELDGDTERAVATLHAHPTAQVAADRQGAGEGRPAVRPPARVLHVEAFAAVVAAFPDSHITVDDIFGQGDEVVVRVVVSGTQEGPIIGIPASGRYVQWDGVDVYRLRDGEISNIWAGDDWTAILHDTGTYTAPWIS